MDSVSSSQRGRGNITSTLKTNRISLIGLVIVLLVYLVLTQFYNLAIPLGKAPDELTHYLYARFISEHGRIPKTPAEQTEAGLRANFPALYHFPAAFLISAITKLSLSEGSKEGEVMLSPALRVTWAPATQQLIDITLPRATLVRTEDERPPYRGEYLAWVVGRWTSTILSAGTIILTFFIVRTLLPRRPYFALLAVTLLALIPAFLFISAVLNDDNMVGLVMAGYLLLLTYFLRGKDAVWLYIGMGLLIGLATTAKYNGGLIALSAAISIWLMGKERGWNWWGITRRVGIVWLTTGIGANWWFVWREIYFNQIEKYGLILGMLKAFVADPSVDLGSNRVISFFSGAVTDPGIPASTLGPNFWDWVRRMFETTWALTVFGVQPYPAYWPIIIFLAVLTLVSVAGLWFTFRQSDAFQKRWIVVFLIHFIFVLPLPIALFFLTRRLNATAQGRHIFYPAAPVILVLLLVGWEYWLKPAQKKWAITLGVGLLLAWAVLHGWHLWWAYPPPLPVRATPGPQMQVEQPTQVNFDELILLTGYQAKLTNEGTVLQLDLLWQSLAQAWEDYRTEITLFDSHGQPQLRWLSHPADGRFPVRAWQPGDMVRDTLYIPLAGLSSGDYEIRLRLLGWDEPLSSSQGEIVTLTTVTLETVPKLTAAALWFQGKMFRISSSSTLPIPQSLPTYRYRSTIPVTLPQPGEATLLGPDGQPRSPITGVGYLYDFIVDYDWPSGDYRLYIDGAETGLILRVENFDTRRDGWNFTPPEMMYTVQANFADKIELLGYDLPARRVEAGGGIPLVLYWRGLTQMREDYTISVQLLDANLARRGGYDRFPRETYNTYLWVPDEVVDDGFAVPVDQDAPEGVYTIRIGLYRQQDGQAMPLHLMHNDQLLDETSVVIGPIKVGGPPPGLLAQAFSPEHPLDVHFGEIIALAGYDLRLEETAIQLKLYWQSLAQTDIDYTIFVHLLDETGRIVAQVDGPPAAGQYPTSLWDRGEVVPASFTLNFPPDVEPGTYQLVVGLYDPVTGVRLSVPGTLENSLLLTEINQ